MGEPKDVLVQIGETKIFFSDTVIVLEGSGSTDERELTKKPDLTRIPIGRGGSTLYDLQIFALQKIYSE